MAIEPIIVQFDPGPLSEGAVSYARARDHGVEIDIPVGTLVTDDATAVLQVKGPLDRLLLSITNLRPATESGATWPVTIQFTVRAGTNCVLDRSWQLSGPADTMTLLSAADRRVGILYELSNLLVGQYMLFAAVTAPQSTNFRAKVALVADHLGGGGALNVERGGVYG